MQSIYIYVCDVNMVLMKLQENRGTDSLKRVSTSK